MFTEIPNRTDGECTGGCCSPKPKMKVSCPRCTTESAKGVLAMTLSHLLTESALSHTEDLEGWHYCKTPTCDVVYFKGKAVLSQEDLRVPVGLKEGVSPAPICYCFEWTKERIAEEIHTKGTSSALEDIKAKMQDPGCDCQRLNPSGACCLADVDKEIKRINASIFATKE